MLHVSRFIIFSEKGSRYDFYSTAESLRKISKLTSTKTHTSNVHSFLFFSSIPMFLFFYLFKSLLSSLPHFFYGKCTQVERSTFSQ